MKTLIKTYTTVSSYTLATRLCQILRCIEVNDPQAINLNLMLNQICNHFTLIWDQQDELEICLYPTMRLLVLLQHISDLDTINLQEIGQILDTCRTAFNGIQSGDNTELQTYVVNTYALAFVHLKVKEKLCDRQIMDQSTDDILSLFEWITIKLTHNVNATFCEYMVSC